MKKQIADTGITDKMFKRQEAIITSMTPAERKKPDILNASRKRRIAKGSGVDVSEVNRVLKQHRQMADAFKMMSRDGGKNMARMAQALGMGGAGGMGSGMPKGVTPPGGMMNAMGAGGMDLNALKALGGGKLPGGPADPNSAAPTGSGLPGLGGFPSLGKGLPNLPGLGRPGSGKK
jgi:signal recognition particle subunit SRP54